MGKPIFSSIIVLDNGKQFSILTRINMDLSEMPPSYHEKVGRREKTLVLRSRTSCQVVTKNMKTPIFTHSYAKREIVCIFILFHLQEKRSKSLKKKVGEMASLVYVTHVNESNNVGPTR